MSFNPKQERLIKARFYRWVLHTHGGDWVRVASELADATGCVIPDESLRQYFRPVSRKAGKRPRGVRDPARLQAMYDLVCQKGYLRAEEQDDEPGDQPLIELQTFLNAGHGEPAPLLVESLVGHFAGSRLGKSGLTDLHIVIEAPDAGGHHWVSESEVIEAVDHPHLEETLHSEGWLVANADGLILCCLRNTYEHTAHCYLLLQSRPALGGQDALTDLALLRYASAWGGALRPSKTKPLDDPSASQLELTIPIDGLCWFLTRVDRTR